MEDALVCPGCRRPPRTDVFRGDPLTPREQAVVRILLLQGCANKAIAEDLRVSLHTVKAHLRNIFTKMGVTSRTELCIMALKNPAIIPPEPPKILPGP